MKKPICWAFTDFVDAEMWHYGGKSKATAVKHGRDYCRGSKTFFVAPCYQSTQEQYDSHGCDATTDSEAAIEVPVKSGGKEGDAK